MEDFATKLTPAIAIPIPAKCQIDEGSPRTRIAKSMVMTGPVEPTMAVRVAPIFKIASLMRKLGITVHTNAMIEA